MRNAVAKLASLLLSVTMVPAALAASPSERPWRRLDTPWYTVVSAVDDAQTLAWARDFDQFLAATTGLLRINPGALPPLTVVLFRRDKDFEPYKLTRPDGRTANISGQFLTRRSFSLMAMAYDTHRSESNDTIYHEATHWLFSGDPRPPPAWFQEGIAEMFSTFERRVETVNWAKPIEGHLRTLNQGALIPFEEFLTQHSALYDSEMRTGRFYAQSWAFVHMLLMSNDPVRRQALLDYIDAWREGTARMAMEKAFGNDLQGWQDALSGYVRRSSYGYMKQPVQTVAGLPAPTAAPPALVEAALGLMALGVGKLDIARDHAQRGLAADARQPRVHELLAYLAAEDGDDAAMARHAREATTSGTRDPQMFLMLGDSYTHPPGSDEPGAGRKRANAYENALNLNPRSYVAYERLMTGLTDLDAPTAEDAKFLALGLKAFPGDDWLKVGNALVAARRGQRDEAAQLMEAALREDSTLDGSQRQYAQARRRFWTFEALNDAVPEALRKRDFAGARAAIEAARPDMSGDEEAERILAAMLAAVDSAENGAAR